MVSQSSEEIVTAYVCKVCDVAGQSPDNEPTCWNCGGPVSVTARPTLIQWSALIARQRRVHG
jgi:hypothetical protein